MQEVMFSPCRWRARRHRLGEPQLIRQQKGFTIFLQGKAPILVERWIGIVKNPRFIVYSSLGPVW